MRHDCWRVVISNEIEVGCWVLVISIGFLPKWLKRYYETNSYKVVILYKTAAELFKDYLTFNDSTMEKTKNIILETQTFNENMCFLILDTDSS